MKKLFESYQEVTTEDIQKAAEYCVNQTRNTL